MSNILIVGANQGIGYYMAIRLLEKGNKVTVLDIQDNHISELKENYQDSFIYIYKRLLTHYTAEQQFVSTRISISVEILVFLQKFLPFGYTG